MRKLFRKTYPLLPLILLLLFSLSGCSKNSKKTYRIGVDPTFFPMDFMGKQAQIFAFSNELLQEIGKIEDVTFERVNRNWDNLIEGLTAKEYDGMLSSVRPFVFNKKKYSFSNLYLKNGPVLVVKKGSSFMSIKDMNGKTLGVIPGSDAAGIIDTYPKIDQVSYQSVSHILNDVQNERVDGALVSYIPAISYVEDIYSGLIIRAPPINDVGLRLLTLYDSDTELLEIFDRGLSKLMNSKKYEELAMKWSLALN